MPCYFFNISSLNRPAHISDHNITYAPFPPDFS